MELLNKRNTRLITAAVLILIISGLIVMISSLLARPFNDWSFNPDASLFGQFGSFIGGFVGTVFSLVAVILLYITLMAQQKAINDQQKSSKTESFESTFFNLLKTQQDLTSSLKSYIFSLNKKFKITTRDVHGREFFIYAKSELNLICQSIYGKEYLGKFDDNPENIMFINNEIDEIEKSSDSKYWLQLDRLSYIDKVHEREKISYINKRYDITQEIWDEIKSLDQQNKLARIYLLFFKRYHYVIGHYFRHLYHLINFAIEFKNSESNQNKTTRYSDFIQAQMSSFELMLLFYNSLLFPRLLRLLKDSNFLENLAVEDLISKSHNCVKGIKLKKRSELLGKTK